MVVDIGGGTTDIAVVALGGMVYDRSVRTAGHHMDEAIIQFMRRRHGLLIGERTAEQVKIEIGSASDTVEPLTMEVRGRCLREGRPRVVIVTDAEIRDALAEPLKVIVAAVREALDRIPPEIAADISDNGIVITGGGALLRGLDERLRQETGVPVLDRRRSADVGRARRRPDARRRQPAEACRRCGVTRRRSQPALGSRHQRGRRSQLWHYESQPFQARSTAPLSPKPGTR